MGNRQPKPTDAELAILRVLWQLGPSTVREVHGQMSRQAPIGYTTILKIMQIMTEKGLVVRDESERAHVYEARFTEQKTQRQLISDLLERAFGGSSSQLVLQALEARRASPKQLREIRRILDQIDKGGAK